MNDDSYPKTIWTCHMKCCSRISIILMFILTLLTAGGCGKEVIPSFKPEGRSMSRSIPYQDDEALLGEESLENVGKNDIYGSNPSMESEEYKQEFGRSTAPLLPVYFDFDREDIRSDQVERIMNNGSYLMENPATRIMVAGNCDERGTAEYNMGLGERRAIQAKQYLVKMGIAEDRIRTVSFGDEMPLFQDSNEWSWARNRRDDFIIE